MLLLGDEVVSQLHFLYKFQAIFFFFFLRTFSFHLKFGRNIY